MRIVAALAVALLAAAGGWPESGVPRASAQDAAPTGGINLDVDELVLENGMRVLTVERPGAPRAFCALYWKVGSVNERPGITGLSHFFEHMMFKGTDTIGTKEPKKDRELNAAIEAVMGDVRALKLRGLEALRRGEPTVVTSGNLKATIHAADQEAYKALLAKYDALVAEQKKISVGEHLSKIFQAHGGLGLNASTYYDWTRYFVDLPSSKVELFFWLESDRFLNPVFREFYPERDVVKEERRMRTDSPPMGLINEAFMSMFWQSHPYGWPVIGWMSDIDQYAYSDAQDYYDTHYTPDNCTAIFVGDVKKERIRELAKLYFGRLPKRKKERPAVVTLESAQVGERRMAAEADAQPQMQIWWHGPAQAHADAPSLDLLAMVLSGRTGRLHRALVDGKKLALSTGATYWGLKYGGALEISAQPREGVSFEDLEKALLEEIERLKTEPVSDRELQKARNQMLGNMVRELDTNDGVATALGFAEIHNSWRDVMKVVPDANKVTAEDIRRSAAKYYVPEGKNVLTVKRKGAAAPPKEGGK